MKNENVKTMVFLMCLLALLIFPSLSLRNAYAVEETPYVELSHWSLVTDAEAEHFPWTHSIAPYETGIAVDSSGKIYVSLPDLFKIKKYSSDGAIEGTWVYATSTTNSEIMAVGTNGAYSAYNSEVRRIPFDGTEFSFDAGDLFIAGLTFDNAGNILLTDDRSWQISKYSTTGVLLERFRLSPSSFAPGGGWLHHSDIAVGRDGLMYVLDTRTEHDGTGRALGYRLSVIVYNPVSTTNSVIDLGLPEFGCGVETTEFYKLRRSSLALDQHGYLYVYCSAPTRSIIKVRNDGSAVLKYTSVPQVDDMTIYGDNLYILDSYNNVYKSALRSEPAVTIPSVDFRKPITAPVKIPPRAMPR